MLFTAARARARGGVFKKTRHLKWPCASPRGADGTAPVAAAGSLCRGGGCCQGQFLSGAWVSGSVSAQPGAVLVPFLELRYQGPVAFRRGEPLRFETLNP